MFAMESQMTPPNSYQLQALLDGPAGKPPAGVVTDFQDSANLNTAVILSATFCIMIPALAVLMRMYTKVYLFKSTTYEDCKRNCYPSFCNVLTPIRRTFDRMGNDASR